VEWHARCLTGTSQVFDARYELLFVVASSRSDYHINKQGKKVRAKEMGERRERELGRERVGGSYIGEIHSTEAVA
jgi:hypothetical protein